MVAFVQVQENIWLLPRTVEGLQKHLQTRGLCICCPGVIPPKVHWWLASFISATV